MLSVLDLNPKLNSGFVFLDYAQYIVTYLFLENSLFWDKFMFMLKKLCESQTSHFQTKNLQL